MSNAKWVCTDMDVCYHFLLVLLLLGCSLEKTPIPINGTGPTPGKPQNVSKNDTEVKKAVLIGTYSFNNWTNDLYFFKASSVDKAQKQIVKGIKYILKLKISRTVCYKRQNDVDLDKCAFQRDHRYQQTYLCKFEVWAIPWMKIMKTTFFTCHPYRFSSKCESEMLR